MSPAALRFADDTDKATILQLLRENKLPVADITLQPLQVFVVCGQGDQLLGVGGLEIYESHALLRSLCVSASSRAQGIGKKILERLLQVARGKFIQDVFLLTTTAPGYFEKMGFVAWNRAEVPEAIKASAEFAELCPDTARCFRMHLSH